MTRTPATVGKTANDLAVPRQDAPASSSTDSTSTLRYKDDLVRCVEHLKALLLTQERERQRQIKYQLKWLQQSGTQNQREEDSLVQKWKHKAGTPVFGTRCATFYVMVAALTHHQAREQRHQQQPLPTGTRAQAQATTRRITKRLVSESFRGLKSGWSNIAPSNMPLLGEAGRNGEQDKQEPTKKLRQTKRRQHSSMSIRVNHNYTTIVSGHVHVVSQDVVARPGSSDSERGTDKEEQYHSEEEVAPWRASSHNNMLLESQRHLKFP
jgi:hypothetical protein